MVKPTEKRLAKNVATMLKKLIKNAKRQTLRPKKKQ